MFISSSNEYSFFIYGGISEYGPMNDLWEFDLLSRTWFFIETFRGFYGLMFFGYSFYIKDSRDYLAIYGGIDINIYSNKLFMYFLHSLDIASLNFEEIIASNSELSLKVERPSIVYSNNYLYMLGGYSSTGEKGVFRYSFENNSWENITDPTYELVPEETAILKLNSCLYAFFGYKNNKEFSGAVFKMDMESWVWELVTENQNYLRTGYSINNVENDLYLFGGLYNGVRNDLVKLKLTENFKLETILDDYAYPEARNNHILKKINSKFYLFGGQNNYGYLKDFWSFDAETEKWTEINSKGQVPTSRHLFAADSFGDSLVIFGGESSAGLLNDIYMYNAIINTWMSILSESLTQPTSRKASCMVYKMPYIYIFGGITQTEYSKELWSFHIGTNEFKLVSLAPKGLAYSNCQLVDDIFQVQFGCDSHLINSVGVYEYDLNSNIWKFKDSFFTTSAGAQGISITIGDNLIYWGGRDQQFITWRRLNIEGDLNMTLLTDSYPHNMAFTYYKTRLYYLSGNKLSIYKTLIPKLKNPIMAYIDLNSSFSAYGKEILCSPGTYHSQNRCERCPKGTYAEEFGNKICTKCKAGSYNNALAATTRRQCYPCPHGYFNMYEGASDCLQCSSLEYCPVGTRSPGKYSMIETTISIQPTIYKQNFDNSTKTNFQIYSSIAWTLLILGFLFSRYKNNIKFFDLYVENHDYDISQSVIRRQTMIGGIFTLFFFAAAFILIGSSIIQYFWDNVNEIKTLQPLVVLEEEVDHFYTDLTVKVLLIKYSESCVAQSNKCVDKVFIEKKNIGKGLESIESTFCEKDIEDTCTITYICENCWFKSGPELQVELQEDYSFAAGVFLNITTSSSIPESVSSIYVGILADKGKVFIGPKSSSFYFTLTPSYFTSSLSTFPSSMTGYHVSIDTPPDPGSQYYVSELSTATQLRVKIFLGITSTAMYTKREINDDVYTVLSALLGSIAGVMSLSMIFMRLSERKYLQIKKKNEINKKLYQILDNHYLFRNELQGPQLSIFSLPNKTIEQESFFLSNPMTGEGKSKTSKVTPE